MIKELTMFAPDAILTRKKSRKGSKGRKTMFFYSYKSYPCAPKATLLSALCTMGEIIALLFAAFLIGMFRKADHALYQKPLALIGGIVLIALAVACYFFVYRKLVPKMAQTETEKNIRSKAKYAYLYCQSNPEAYEELRAINAEFARQYAREDSGKLVKIKNP